MPADKPFETKELSAQINSARLSFAGEEAMLEYLDIQPGAVSVLGLMNDSENAVALLVDEDQLKIPEALGKNTVKTALQIPFHIVHRNDDTYFRIHNYPPQHGSSASEPEA